MGYEPQLYGYTDSTLDPRVLADDDPRLNSYEELMAGFDEKLRLRLDSDDTAWRDHLAAKGKTLPPLPDTYRPVGDRLSDPAPYSSQDSDTAFLTDRFLQDVAQNPPGWFAALTYIRPHPPLVAPEPYNQMYDPADMPPARQTLSNAGDRDWHPFLAPAQDKQAPKSMVVGFPDLDPSKQTTAELRAIYLGLATEVDHHIGRVIDWLKDTGQWDDTILVVTADHGEMLGDFGLWGKSTFHDAAFHVPLIIRDPAQPGTHGDRVNGMTESIDVAVTLLDRLGADIPHTMNGQSLMPQLEDASAPTKDHTVSEYDFGNPVEPTIWMRNLDVQSREANLTVLRTETHRLVQFGCDIPPILFDMDGEGERCDISNQNNVVSILLDLTRQMLCHRMVNPDGTFARTIAGDGGVRIGNF